MILPETIPVSIQSLAPILAETVSSGRSAEITVTGHSMGPLLIDRKSRVRLTAPGDPKKGDMVFYRRDDGTYVLHRVVELASDGTYTICGDAQVFLERGIRKDQIFAKVEAFARREKWVSCTNKLYALWWHLHLADLPLRRFFVRGKGWLKRHLVALMKKGR